MKVLAKAFPNESYKYYTCLSEMVIEARLSESDKVFFYEVGPDYETRLNNDTVKNLFDSEKNVRFRAFNPSEKRNRDFNVVLHRDQKKHKKKFERLMNGESDVDKKNDRKKKKRHKAKKQKTVS